MSEEERIAGFLELERADVQWFLSLDERDLPEHVRGVQPTFRSIIVDGSEIEFSTGFRDLHTRVYEEVLAGNGFGIEVARPAIELVYTLRHAKPAHRAGEEHPFVYKANTPLPGTA